MIENGGFEKYASVRKQFGDKRTPDPNNENSVQNISHGIQNGLLTSLRIKADMGLEDKANG